VKSLAQRLAFARELRGLTQAELARRAHCSQSTLGNAEAGLRHSLRDLVAVARALEVSVDWLYDGKGEAPIASGLAVNETRATYGAPYWLFSAELFNTIRTLPADGVLRLENTLRAVLGLSPTNEL
jgi:transcriptional regulator with XRE-family HTH domain